MDDNLQKKKNAFPINLTDFLNNYAFQPRGPSPPLECSHLATLDCSQFVQHICSLLSCKYSTHL